MDVEKQPLPSENVQSETDDETLGGGDKQVLQAKKEELKLIEKGGGGDQQNGETKIKIMEPEKAFSGMTKDELMKYANDPFWVRLRWFLFILFWAVWLAMLVGALLIIVYAPKCAAPEKLSWWKAGPLVVADKAIDAEALKSIDATGIVFKVPGDDTYDMEKLTKHREAIEALVAASNNKDVKIIVDLVANYVPESDDLFLNGLVDKTKRSPFVWEERANVPNNWLALAGGSAWKLMNDSSYILSQFGEKRYDLQLSQEVNKERLKKVIREFGKLPSVCGFRLANTKHFIVKTATLRDEEPVSGRTGVGHDDYNFWTHSETVYVDGLSDLLAELKSVAINATGGHCESTFFGSSDATDSPDVYEKSSGSLTIESVPIKFNLFQHQNTRPEAIVQELTSLKHLTTTKKLWAEHHYSNEAKEASFLTEQYLFTFLLPGGVPLLNQWQLEEDTKQTEKSLKLVNLLALRDSPSFMYGTFDVYQDANSTLVGYTRVKAGSPGYLVVYNPTGASMKGNFNSTGIETDLTVHLLSQNYKEEGINLKHKLLATEIPVSAHSVAVLTFVQSSG